MNRIEEKYGLKPSYAYSLLVILALNITWLICAFVFFAGNMTSYHILLPLFMLVVAMFYACHGYKKAHGNQMKYLFLTYAVFIAITVVLDGPRQTTLINSAYLAVIILIAYMSGRLGHYKQNVIISAIVFAIICITTFYSLYLFSKARELSLLAAITWFGPTTIWLAIVGAYLTRYKLHKEAGFDDKKD